MFAVIFEVQPKPERWDDYLALAKQLRPKLEAIDGFIENERFGSKKTEGRLLSLSIWRDEKSVVRWRTHGEHHGVQREGRAGIFADYHLRVGEIVADNAPPAGLSLTEQCLDQTEVGEAKFCSITGLSAAESNQPPPDALDHELFESITNSGKLLLLASWRDRTAARSWRLASPNPVRYRLVRVIRDYGMFDRRE